SLPLSTSLLHSFLHTPPPPNPTLFPYTTLFRSNTANQGVTDASGTARVNAVGAGKLDAGAAVSSTVTVAPATASFGFIKTVPKEDRKSTRLNSSHVAISYAVFCLKKKK